MLHEVKTSINIRTHMYYKYIIIYYIVNSLCMI